MENFLVPAEEIRRDIQVLNSKFIAIAAPASSVEEAQQVIRRIRSQFPDASHHVPAYCIGHGSSVTTHCSDAGEPSGTAGRPVLAVLTGSGLGDIVVVVTRYFGGTKLGTGGLVRAYGGAAREVLDAVPRAVKSKARKASITLDYPDYESARMEINKSGATILDQNFTGDVTMDAIIPLEKYEQLAENLRNITRGGVRIEIGDQVIDVLIPVK